MEPHFYEVNIEWQEGRKGLLSAAGVQQEIEVVTPPQFPNGVEGIWSPEHLFTAAVSSCLMTTFLAVAENSKLAFSSFSCQAKGKLELVDGKMVITEVFLEPKLVIPFERDKEKAARILKKAEAACLISNSVKSKILMPNMEIEIAEQKVAA